MLQLTEVESTHDCVKHDNVYGSNMRSVFMHKISDVPSGYENLGISVEVRWMGRQKYTETDIHRDRSRG